MKLDPSKYKELQDKNGSKPIGDMYCHKCTGSFMKMRHAITGRGKMVCVGVINRQQDDNKYHFVCVKCEYERFYPARYVKDYGIR